jgi:hypothetical protein
MPMAWSYPGSWPIIGKYELALDEEWHQFDMPASEFVHRALTRHSGRSPWSGGARERMYRERSGVLSWRR